METPSLDLPDPELVARTFNATLAKSPKPLFAVVDGGLFDDLPGLLRHLDLSARSLFLEHADKDIEAAGPWLVTLNDEASLDQVQRLALEQPCAVFWSCPDGEVALWRHLRTLNECLIPIESEDPSAEGVDYERVLFRHWDPNVLAALLPALDAAQFARVFGPAVELVMYSPDSAGVVRAPRPVGLPPAPHGALRIRPEQIESLRKAMVHSSRLRIARFLRDNMPDDFVDVTDEFVWGATLASEISAEELGITSERGRARWAYLMVVSDGKAIEASEVRDYIQNGENRPDDQVKSLIEFTADALADQGSG